MNSSMKKMLRDAQKMQREIEKKRQELAETEFEVTKGGGVTVIFTGDKKMQSIKIDPDLLEEDNAELLEEMITLAVNEIIEAIDEEEEAISMSVAGQGGLF
ncbi:MAG: YbaB/EbfC family nucleoid-associated protein [Erysipelotrichaceae bacterium]|nr:YbaB/EbfC family nucleoid-associated protein [Erysipelotrichaceae bacterium]